MRAKDYIESFLPLFVAVNVLGILPMYLGLTAELPPGERRRLTLQAVATASLVAVLILFAGQLIFSLLGITVNDLRVGGDLGGHDPRRHRRHGPGALVARAGH